MPAGMRLPSRRVCPHSVRVDGVDDKIEPQRLDTDVVERREALQSRCEVVDKDRFICWRGLQLNLVADSRWILRF